MAIGLWSGSYIVQCLHALEAPGVPIRLEYKTPGGVLTFTADSYVLDVEAGTLRLWRPKVVDPDGELLAGCESLGVEGLKTFLGQDRSVRAHLGSVEGQLRRLKSGRLSVERYFPPQKEKQAGIPFEVEVDGLRVVLIDEMGARPFRQEIQSEGFLVSGSGDDWLAGGRITAEGIGSADLSLQNVEGSGLHVAARTRELDLLPIIRHLATTEPLRKSDLSKLSAETLQVVGPVRAFFPKDREARLETRLVLRGEKVRFEDVLIDRMTFRGRLNDRGALGVLDAVTSGTRLRADGSAKWLGNRVRASGAVEASVANRNALPESVAKMVPTQVGFQQARFNGWAQFETPQIFAVRGEVRAARVRYDRDAVSELWAEVSARPSRVTVNVRGGSYGDLPLRGVVSLDPQKKGLNGSIRAPSVDLALISRRFGVAGLSGSADLAATVSGTLEQPTMALLARGDAEYLYEGRSVKLGHFEVDGRVANNTLQIRRGVIRGPLGLVAANGTIGNSGESIGIGVVARRLDPSSFIPQLQGEANATFRIGGNLKQPVARGYVEGYNFQYGDRLVPAIRADLVADRERVSLRALRATGGTTEITGGASLTLRNRVLAGEFRAQGLQLADLFPPEESVAGSLDVPKLTIAGTLQRPRVEVDIRGAGLVVRGVKIDRVQGRVLASPDNVRLESLELEASGGKATAQGQFLPEQQQGQFQMVATNFDLKPFASQVSSEVTLEGRASGQLSGSMSSGGVAALQGEGRLDEVRVNGKLVGAGPWSIAKQGSGYRADLQVGTLERYVQLEGLQIDPDSRSLNGMLWVKSLRAEDLTAIADRYLGSLSVEGQRAVEDLAGDISAGVEISGSFSRPSVNLQNFEIPDLRYRELSLGALTASLGADDGRWKIDQIALRGPVGTIEIAGTVDEEGETDLSGEVRNISLLELGRAVPGVASLGGQLRELTFVVRGPTSSPRVRASADLDGMLTRPNDPEKGLAVNLGDIRIDEMNGIRVDGNYSYRGFAGAIQASVPIDYPFSIPDDGMLSARVGLNPRTLDGIAAYFPSLDPERSEGTIEGEVVATGKPNALNFDGRLSLRAGTIGFLIPPLPIAGQVSNAQVPVGDTLRNVEANVLLSGGDLTITAKGESSRGGTLDARVSSPLGQLSRLESTLRDEGAEGLLATAVEGSLILDGLALRQDLAPGAYVGGTVTGTVNLAGTLRRPRLATPAPVLFSKVDAVLPIFEPKESEGSVSSVNPRFDLKFALADPARLRTTAAELFVLGDGTLAGTLTAPDLRAGLEVDRGSLLLPGGRVRLEQGGTVDVTFDSTRSEAMARALVDLEGTTAVTAQRFGTTYERYEITLGVRGDLLAEGGLNLTARSDPPDLSPDRILALLGQTDLLEAIGRDPGSSETEQRIRNALAGYALPALADPITNRLAQGLGLDYLSLEYNPFEEASVAFAKALGSGFFVQGRRQISDPPPGFRAQYDVRLLYRPRRLRGALSRITFTLGADQDTPFKFAIEYGVRF